MTDAPVLETERFTCRNPVDQDVDVFWPAFSSEAQMRYWSRGPFTDKAEMRDYLLDRDAGRSWVAEPRSGGPPVFRLFASEPHPGVSEIGYIMVPGHEGQGIARECVSALVTQLLRAEGMHKIIADVDPRNTASARLLLGLGFTREAHLREAMETHIGWCDSWLFGLLSDEWQD